MSTRDNKGVGGVGRMYRTHRNPSSMLSYHSEVDSDECVICVLVHVIRIKVFISSPGTTASSLRRHALGCNVYLQGVYLGSHGALQVRASKVHISVLPLPNGVILPPVSMVP